MILRAVFWIAVVSFFLPREPDLGYGRPGNGADGIGGLLEKVETNAVGKAVASCADGESGCSTAFSLLDMFQDMAVRSFDEVKADIAENRRTKLTPPLD